MSAEDFPIPLSRDRVRALVVEAFAMGAALHADQRVNLTPTLQARLRAQAVDGSTVCGALAVWLLEGRGDLPLTLLDLNAEAPARALRN